MAFERQFGDNPEEELALPGHLDGGPDDATAIEPYAYTELKPLLDDELKALLQTEIYDALGNLGSNISEDRRSAIAMYYGKPFGNEQVGRSQVVLTDVADTIEWIMPSMIRMFLGGEQLGRYKPRKEGQQESAKQASDYVNDLIQDDDDGFIIFYDWMKTALIEKNSVVKVYYEELIHPEEFHYKQITELELEEIAADDDVKIIGMEPRDETLPVEDPETGEMVEIPTFDVTVQRIKKKKQIKLDVIPPEEFLIARRSIRLNDETAFSCHRVKKTVSDLIAMGFDPDVVLALPSDDLPEFSLERTERMAEDEVFPVTSSERADAAAREIWLNDCYIRVDYDGDGYTELRHIIAVGDTSIEILSNEVVNFNPFCHLVPVPMPHKFFGLSVADQVKDLQIIRSTLLRQMLDNIYLTNNSRYAVVSGQVEIDDLLNSLPGGIVRMDQPGMVEPLVTQPLSPMAFSMLEYLEGVKESRTGVSRINQGIGADTLNKTASGQSALMEAANTRIETIARIFAETGFKRLFKLYLRLIIENPVKDQIVELNGKWVKIDPSTWDDNWGVTIEVGLGVGAAAQRVGTLSKVLEMQSAFFAAGLGGLIVEPQNAYNAAREIELAMGYRAKNYFFTDPAGKPPPEPEPDADMEKVKQSAAEAEQINAVKMKEIEVNALRIAQDGKVRDKEMELRAEVEREANVTKLILERERMEVDLKKAQIQAETTLAAARINAEAQHESAEIAARATKQASKANGHDKGADT